MLKQLVLTRKKSIKKKQFHPENAGNGICESVHFTIFPGEYAPGPPYDPSSYATRRADKGPSLLPPQKKFLDPYAYDLAWYDKIR